MSLFDDMEAAVEQKEKELGRKLTEGEKHEIRYNVELDRELEVHGIPIRVSRSYALANRDHPYFSEYAECPLCGDFFGKRFLELHQKQDHAASASTTTGSASPHLNTSKQWVVKFLAGSYWEGSVYHDAGPEVQVGEFDTGDEVEDCARGLAAQWQRPVIVRVRAPNGAYVPYIGSFGTEQFWPDDWPNTSPPTSESRGKAAGSAPTPATEQFNQSESHHSNWKGALVVLTAVCIGIVIAAMLIGKAGNDSNDVGSTPNVESPQCAQLKARFESLMERQTAEDVAIENRQTEEFDRLLANLKASGASEYQVSIAINNLTTRQDIENEARKNREDNELATIHEEEVQAGCSPKW